MIKNLLDLTVHNAHDGVSFAPAAPPSIIHRYEVCAGFWRTYIKPAEMPDYDSGTLLIVPSSVRATYPDRNDLISPANLLGVEKDSITCNGFEVNGTF